MKRLLSILLAAMMLLSVVPFSASAATNSNYDIVLEVPEAYKAGDTVTVVAKVTNINIDGGFSVVQFVLNYDNANLMINASGSSVDAFDASGAFSDWEDFTFVNTDENLAPLNDGTVKLEAGDGNEHGEYYNAVNGDELVFTLTFTALEDASSDVDFWISASETKCMVYDDTELGYSTYHGTITKVQETVVYNANSINGHIPGADATCTEDQICTECGYVIAEATGHDYSSTVVKPTETEQGYTEHVCGNCDDTYRDNYTDYQPDDNKPDDTTPDDTEKPLRGDVDADGEITASDYLYLKRIYFGTLKMSALEDPDNAKYRCDVEVNDLIEAMDYILLKRAYFGTYKIVQE